MKPSDPIAGASTVTELNGSDKVGSGGPNIGRNPTVGPLDRVRVDSTGRVLTTAGKPVARALIDFWQADAGGVYDNSGYRFRGHQLTDAKGRYALTTVVPGLYPGRTKHIHVKVQPRGGSILTTQLYFPGVARNRSYSIFHSALLVRNWRKVGARRAARFDFVLG